jgi:hypothetical protein
MKRPSASERRAITASPSRRSSSQSSGPPRRRRVAGSRAGAQSQLQKHERRAHDQPPSGLPSSATPRLFAMAPPPRHTRRTKILSANMVVRREARRVRFAPRADRSSVQHRRRVHPAPAPRHGPLWHRPRTPRHLPRSHRAHLRGAAAEVRGRHVRALPHLRRSLAGFPALPLRPLRARRARRFLLQAPRATSALALFNPCPMTPSRSGCAHRSPTPTATSTGEEAHIYADTVIFRRTGIGDCVAMSSYVASSLRRRVRSGRI